MARFEFLTLFTFIFCLSLSVDGIKDSPGGNNLRDFVPNQTIQAEDFSFGQNFEIYNSCNDSSIVYVGSTTPNTVLEYDQVNFGYGVDGITLRVTNYYPSSALNISLHLGSYNNTPFISIPVNYTGNHSDRCDFVTLNANFASALIGVQDLFFTFPSNLTGNINFDWFVLNQVEAKFIATQRIEAENFSSSENTLQVGDCSNTSIKYIGELSSSSLLQFDLVDFGSGVEIVTIRVYSFYDGGLLDIDLHLDNATNVPFGTVQVGQTGTQKCSFVTLDNFLETKPSGVHDLFLTFPSAHGGSLNLDWLVFNQTVTSK